MFETWHFQKKLILPRGLIGLPARGGGPVLGVRVSIHTQICVNDFAFTLKEGENTNIPRPRIILEGGGRLGGAPRGKAARYEC